jgi:hypothetical protein
LRMRNSVPTCIGILISARFSAIPFSTRPDGAASVSSFDAGFDAERRASATARDYN